MDKTMKAFTKSMISQRLFGRDGIKEYGEKVKELTEKARQIDETAVLYIALFEGRERYREVSKALGNILDIEKIFSQRAIERNPEIANEMAQAYEHLKKFNDIVAKRKKRINAAKKQKEQIEAVKNQEHEEDNIVTQSENIKNLNNSTEEI